MQISVLAYSNTPLSAACTELLGLGATARVLRTIRKFSTKIFEHYSDVNSELLPLLTLEKRKRWQTVS